MIPRLLLQTAPEAGHDLDSGVRDRLMSELGQDWTYQFFSNADQLEYLRQQSIPGMPDLARAWSTMHLGHHASDLFRYVYLWQHGGVYLDFDAMVYDDLSEFIEADFFTAQSGPHKMLPGFIGCRQHSELMWSVALDAYHVDRVQLGQDYGLLCQNLNNIVLAYSGTERVCILDEQVREDIGQGWVTDPVTSRGPIMIHYYRDKIIP